MKKRLKHPLPSYLPPVGCRAGAYEEAIETPRRKHVLVQTYRAEPVLMKKRLKLSTILNFSSSLGAEPVLMKKRLKPVVPAVAIVPACAEPVLMKKRLKLIPPMQVQHYTLCRAGAYEEAIETLSFS